MQKALISKTTLAIGTLFLAPTLYGAESVYEVREGDSLSHIAMKFSKPFDSNVIYDPNRNKVKMIPNIRSYTDVKIKGIFNFTTQNKLHHIQLQNMSVISSQKIDLSDDAMPPPARVTPVSSGFASQLLLSSLSPYAYSMSEM